MISSSNFSLKREEYSINCILENNIIRIQVDKGEEEAYRYVCEFESFTIEVESQPKEISASELYQYLHLNQNMLNYDDQNITVNIYQQDLVFGMEKIEKNPFWDTQRKYSTYFEKMDDEVKLIRMNGFDWFKQVSRIPLPRTKKIMVRFYDFFFSSSRGIGIGVISEEAIDRKMRVSLKESGCICYWYQPECYERQGRLWNSSVRNEGKNEFDYFSIGVTDISLTVTIDLPNLKINWDNEHETHDSRIDEKLAENDLYFYIEMGQRDNSVRYEIL